MGKLRTVCAAVLVTLVSAVAVPGAALAGTSSGESTNSVEWFRDCTPGYFCVFEHANGTGEWFRDYQTPYPNLLSPIGGFVYDKKISAVYNRSNRHWCINDGTNHTGDSGVIPPGFGGSLVDVGWNDRIRSFELCGL